MMILLGIRSTPWRSSIIHDNTGNVIEAETIIESQNSKSYETITLHPKQSVITNITEGSIIGSRTITLSMCVSNDQSKLRMSSFQEYL